MYHIVDLVHGSALKRQALREPIGVLAVIIDHVILLDRLDGILRGGIKVLRKPSRLGR